ncbi:hypothetical protein O181_046086 [Austropuccinia psidii MF-1]|uniref:CCHC-type domain-containing protein n=1 Tax=Austropuccinia psidii MF-1 TaxID=1389203 RepID=A0A9Q3DLB7_9BASI|nr:hypothetical protein [Austropuccinia psidii MF-1]
MENSFEIAIFSSNTDKPLTWFLKHKYRLSPLHPDISYSIINIKILRQYGGELEHAIKLRCVEPCSAEYYINAMEDIITRTRIVKASTRNPIESRMVSKTSIIDRRPERPVLKCHKCGRTSHLANTSIKKTKINEFKFIEEVQCAEETEESDQYSSISEDTKEEYYHIENITALFEVTEFHTQFPQYTEYCYKSINIEEARMCKTKTSGENAYTAGASCIRSILMNDVEAKVNLDAGAFLTCV